MTPRASTPLPGRGDSVVLDNVDWKTYGRMLRTFAERSDVRLTYDRGRLELMAPLLAHDEDGRFLGDMVYVMTDELGLTLKRGGSVTMRRSLRRRGIEADESFWIANALRMAGRRRLDLSRDPPPDLCAEVDVSHSSLDRLSIYAALKVPEVWRLDGDVMTFYILGEDGEYRIAERSRAFPFVSPADLMPFLLQARAAGDQNPILRQFREWVRQHRP